MGSCNTTQNEQSGKDFILKICTDAITDATVAVGTADDPTLILKTGHGLVAGDLVQFTVIPGTVSEVAVDTVYFVKEVSTTGFKISATYGGTAITFSVAIATGLSYEPFTTLGGLRSNGISYAAAGVETTNYGSNQWRSFKDGAGIKSATVTGEGVVVNTTNFVYARTKMINASLTCFAFCNVSTGEIEWGCFKITALEKKAENGGEATYTLSAESSGAINYVAAV